MKIKYNLPILNALEFFIKNPNEKIHLREFARQLKISVNSAQRFLRVFLDEGFVKDYRRVNLRYFRANLDSIVFRNLKITYSLREIENSGLLDLLKSFSHVVLFGSVAKGVDDKNSDLDLVCIGKIKKQNLDLSKFEKVFSKEINVHVFNFEKWRENKTKNKAFYQEVISTGINLIGEMPI